MLAPAFRDYDLGMANAIALSARDLDLRHVWHGNVQHQGLDQRPPLEIDRADDVWVWDVEGRRYLDAMAGLWCVNVGYGRREIVCRYSADDAATVLSADAVAWAGGAVGGSAHLAPAQRVEPRVLPE